MTGISTIGERIRAVRSSAELSLERFAAVLGYSRRTLITWEQNDVPPPIAVLTKLRMIYDVDPEWILMGEGTTPRKHYSAVDWPRLDRLQKTVNELCDDMIPMLTAVQRLALTRVQYDAGADDDKATSDYLRGVIGTLLPELRPSEVPDYEDQKTEEVDDIQATVSSIPTRHPRKRTQ